MNHSCQLRLVSRWCAGCVVLAALLSGGCVPTAWVGGNSSDPQSTTEDPCDPPPNGCGPGGWLETIVPECPLGLVCFGEACNHHDACYSTCGSSRAVCDEQFHTDLLAACTDSFAPGDPRLGRCRALAYVYWQAVTRFGGSYFESDQEQACACPDAVPAARLIAPALAEAVIEAPFPDRDDDLMPDDWERAVGLNPDNPRDAWSDDDGDGLTNLQEFVHGLDPRNADSDAVAIRR